MSTVVAMIYHGEICLASDTMSIDHETGQEVEAAIKQITINEEIAIGFTGSGDIALTIMNTFANPKNAHIVSKFTIGEMPAALEDIYQSHIAGKQYPDEETRHISALIVGINNCKPEIIYWDSNGTIETIEQDHPNNFTAFVLPPYDMDRTTCNEILWEIATNNFHFVSLSEIAIDYFKVVASKSQFVSEKATIWTHTTPTFGVSDIV